MLLLLQCLLPIIKTIVPLFGVNDAEKGNSNFAKAMVLGASYGSFSWWVWY